MPGRGIFTYSFLCVVDYHVRVHTVRLMLLLLLCVLTSTNGRNICCLCFVCKKILTH